MKWSSRDAQGGVAVIALEGGFDPGEIRDFAEEAEKVIDAYAGRVVLDLSRCTFITSQGVGSLLALHTRARKRGGDAKFAAVRGMVADVIRTTGLHLRFEQHPTVDAAVAAFAAAPKQN